MEQSQQEVVNPLAGPPESDCMRRVERIMRRKRIVELLETLDDLTEDRERRAEVRPSIYYSGGHYPHTLVNQEIAKEFAGLVDDAYRNCIANVYSELSELGVKVDTIQ